MTIVSLSEKFKQIDTDKIIEQSFDETTSIFEEENIAQLRAGKTKTGKSISPKYKNAAYAKKKFAMNPLPGFGIPDLILKGDFTSQINVKLEGESIYEFSNDVKGPMLENKYPNIFGLGTTYKQDYLSKGLGPVVRKKITDFTGLKFGK